MKTCRLQRFAAQRYLRHLCAPQPRSPAAPTLPATRDERRLRGGLEGNGCAERLIRTLKEQMLWLRPFQSV